MKAIALNLRTLCSETSFNTGHVIDLICNLRLVLKVGESSVDQVQLRDY